MIFVNAWESITQYRETALKPKTATAHTTLIPETKEALPSGLQNKSYSNGIQRYTKQTNKKDTNRCIKHRLFYLENHHVALSTTLTLV